MKLTVFHDGQYWVGVLEEQFQGKLRAAKYMFGGEPKDEEILQFVCHDHDANRWRTFPGSGRQAF